MHWANSEAVAGPHRKKYLRYNGKRNIPNPIACHLLQENRCNFDDLALAPADLAELLSAMDEGIISGKIGKQVLPELLQVPMVCSALQWLKNNDKGM